jgi:uncharacterized protein DUF6188
VITESADRYEVDLKDHKVMQCVVDFAFTLELERLGQRVTVRLEGPFTLSRDGQTHEMDAELRPRELGPALDLTRTSVRAADVQKTGELELTFDDGAVLWVGSDPNFEAWTLTVTDGPIIVSGPGGKLTFFRSPSKLD